MRRTVVTLALLLTLAACSGGDDAEEAAGSSSSGGGGGGGAPSEPCDVTEPDVVAEVVGGTVPDEVPGEARNCSYAVDGGEVAQVEVYYFGTADDFAGLRDGYEQGRGPVTDVAGVGEEAFSPADVGENEVVVLAGDTAFAVGLGGGAITTDPVPQVKELAARIADDLG